MGAAGVSLPSGGGKGRGRLRRARGRRGAAERLQRLGLEVRGFVEAAGPLPRKAPLTTVPKSRRELRRDRRRLKRGRRRHLLSGNGETQAARRPQKPREEEEERPTTKPPEGRRPPAPAPVPSRPPPSATAASSARKRALLSANEAEEREIRRLERQLGLSRRRKRRQEEGRGEALPQSFLRDGLGYVLEALQPQDNPSGLWQSSSEEEEEGRAWDEARRKRGSPVCQEEESEEEEEGWGDEVRRKRGGGTPEEEEEGSTSGGTRRKRGAPGCQEEEESEEEDWRNEVRRKRRAPECQEEEESWRDEAKRKKGGGTPEEGRTNDEARGRRTGEGQEQQRLGGEEIEEEESEEDDGDSSSLEEEEESPMEEEVAADEREGLGFGSPDAGAPESSPPTQKGTSHSTTKYVPPQMRKTEETIDARKKEVLERLKKTLKGLINRLSEPNMASISGQLEDHYMANSRKDMNETLTEILLSACVTETAMPSRLVMEHVLLVSILHCTVGIEVGAHFLETVVKKFDEAYRSDAEGKECENLLNLIAHLYNFRVVHSVLIFDILKKLLSSFSEKDIELMLLLLKNVGFSLRKDDALALKEVITEAQKKANAVGKQFQDQSRVCFMLEIMLALKNNDMRKIPGYDPEPVEKLRKLQRTLIGNSGSGKDSQLRVSLDSLLSAEQVGRWWIVGSSWSGAPMIDSTSNNIQQILPQGKVSSKILELARKQRMNTDIRRNIFCILMTSEDFLDAFEKLLKLRLKDQQEREIVHVLLDCCLQEKTYNPFYAYLSAKFCEYERRFQMTFQFSMWDKFRDLGNLSTTAFSNLVNLLAHLLKTKSLSLTVFKVIEFSELDKTKVHLLRRVLTALLLMTDPEDLNHIFGRLADNPKLGMLHEGLKLFLTHFLLKNIQAHKSTEEAALLKERIELVNRTLKAKESRLKL